MQRADCMHWSVPFYLADLSISTNSSTHGGPRTNPSWILKDNLSFWGVKVKHRFMLIYESAPITSRLFKDQLYSNQVLLMFFVIVWGEDDDPQSRWTLIRYSLSVILSRLISAQMYYKLNVLCTTPSKLSSKLPRGL